MSYKAIVFCDVDCLIDVQGVTDNFLTFKGAVDMYGPEQAATYLNIASPRFSLNDWDYLSDRYVIGVVEPIQDQHCFDRALRGLLAMPDVYAHTVEKTVQAVMKMRRCAREEVLVVHSDEYMGLTRLLEDWQL